MKKLQSVVLAISLVGAMSANAALIFSDDFSSPVVPVGGTYIAVGGTLTGFGWTVVGSGNVELVNAGTGYWPGNLGQFLDLTGSTGGAGIRSGGLTTIIGQQYLVTFDAYNGSLVSPGPPGYKGKAIKLKATGNSAVSYKLTPGTDTVLSYYFTATATTTKLTFRDLSGSDSNAGWIDNITVSAVPETSTVIAGALLLLPFGVSTVRILRKNRTA